MTTTNKKILATTMFAAFCAIVAFSMGSTTRFATSVSAQGSPTPTPAPTVAPTPAFDQAAALAKLREQIKGHEQEPSDKVWKNIKTPFIKSLPAGAVLNIMRVAYAGSLGVTCTHCHVPDKWESDEISTKQTTRDMAAMMAKINGELLKGIPNLSQTATVNCTTCHRGQVKPALNLPPKT